MTPLTTTFYFYQDGAVFYLFKTPECDGDHMKATYPIAVSDSDVQAAKFAREWFLDDWCPAQQIEPIERVS